MEAIALISRDKKPCVYLSHKYYLTSQQFTLILHDGVLIASYYTLMPFTRQQTTLWLAMECNISFNVPHNLTVA